MCATAGSKKPIVAVTNDPTKEITLPSCGMLAVKAAAMGKKKNK